MKQLLYLSLGLVLISCDAYVSLPYAVKNPRAQTVNVFVPNYRCSDFSRGRDTVIGIPAHGSLLVGSSLPSVTGPVGARKRIYRRSPGYCGLVLLQTDSVPLGCSTKEWRLRRGVAVLEIKN